MDEKFSQAAGRRGAIASRGSDAKRMVLPRACRLVHPAEYDAVYSDGRRRTSREFTIFLRPNDLEISRFGWSIKKALGNAVRRNRIRRRLREVLRLHRGEIAQGWDIVIHPRGSVATAPFLALTDELLRIMPRVEQRRDRGADRQQ